MKQVAIIQFKKDKKSTVTPIRLYPWIWTSGIHLHNFFPFLPFWGTKVVKLFISTIQISSNVSVTSLPV